MTRRGSPALVILLCSAAALAAALISEYGFGLQPCQLCLYQRVPYCLAAAVAIIALRTGAKWDRALLGLCALLFIGNSGLALFHAGVEQHWWAGPASCSSGGAGGAQTIEELMAQLNKPVKLPSCDQIAWSLFGISMAGYNVLVSLGLALYAGVAATRSKERTI
jgi:disulfide bond formation protein DsbB